jgi:hypothetical protein
VGPLRVGLSHMAKEGEKEVVVPGCVQHFAPHGSDVRADLKRVDGELAQDGEIFRGMIQAAAVFVFGEDNIEDPMQIVLDAPMAAHDLEQLGGGELSRQQEVADRLDGSGVGTPPAGDAADRFDAGKAVLGRHVGCRDDGSLTPFAPVVRQRAGMMGARSASGGREAGLDRPEELGPVFLEGQHIVAFAVWNGLGHGGRTVQGIGSNNGAIEIEQGQDFVGAGDLVAIGGLSSGPVPCAPDRPRR